MSSQISLFESAPLEVVEIPTCAFGTLWPHETCAGCEAESARLEAEFWRKVAAGEYDEQGYTPAERKLQQRKAAR